MATESVLVPEYGTPISFDGWVEANKVYLKPPVGNKLMFGAGQHKVMVIGGPNQRKDYHLDCGEELFWQLKGDMVLEVMEKGRPKSIPIKEGEMFLLPPLIPHSPQRPADTIGFVMERERLASESDAMRWYVDGTTDVLLQKVFHCHDLGTELPPIIKEYKESEEFRTGVPSGAPIPEFPHPVDVTSELPAPVNFEAWVADHRDVNAYIFGGPDTTAEYAVLVVTKGLVWDEWHHNPGETWFYVKAGGGAELTLRDRDGAEKPVALRETDSLLLPHGWSYKGSWGAGVGLVVTNKVL